MLNRYDWPLWHWHFELSSICTLKCPRCPRTELPETLVQDQLRLSFFEANFPADVAQHMRRITFCGDDGDPIYAKDFIPIVRYFKTIDPTISLQIITNGGYKTKEWWEELGGLLNEYDEIHFSIDGSTQEISEKYRVNSDHAGSLLGMKTISETSKALISWDMIAFSFNQDDIEASKTLAKSLGADQFQLTLSTKFGSIHSNYLTDGVDLLEPREEFLPSAKRFERMFTKFTRKMLKDNGAKDANIAAYNAVRNKSTGPIIPLCKIGTKGMFVNSRGYLIPCCWVGNRYNWAGYRRFQREDNQIQNVGLEAVLNNEAWESFFNDFVKMPECINKCSAHLVNVNYATMW